MKSQITLVLGMILLLGVVSAIYSGETYKHTFDGEIINCSIINNTFNLDGLNLSWNGYEATIDTQINYYPDNFILSCWINQSVEVAEIVTSSGGGHHHKEVIPTNTTNVTTNNETINLNNEKIGNEGNGRLEPINQTNQTESGIGNLPKESILNKIGNFFESIWNWFRELFK